MPPNTPQKCVLFPLLLAVLLVAPLAFAIRPQDSAAQSANPPMLAPIGGGYSPVALNGFFLAAAERAPGNQLKLLVLPIGMAAHHIQVSDTERREQMRTAESRRDQLEQLCQRVLADRLTCRVALAPILSRPDAESTPLEDYFTPDLAGVMILSGNPSTAMLALNDTPVERALEQAYQRGAIISGTNPSTPILATHMLSGFMPGFDTHNTLEFGAVELWGSTERRGLSFGVQNAILEQQFFERGRLGRLLNAITQSNVPHVGVGIDSDTGIYLFPGLDKISGVFGAYTVAVLDAQTYRAADAVQYHGAQNWISLRNVLFHLLASGDYTYDLATRQHSLVAPPKRIERRYIGAVLPASAGPLLLTSNLDAHLPGSPLLNRFINWSGGTNARLLIVASGFSSQDLAVEAANRYKNAIVIPSQTLIVAADSTSPLSIPAETSGIILIAQDASLVNVDSLQSLAQAWRQGTPLLADNAGATVVGQFYAAYPPTPQDESQAEAITQGSLLLGSAPLRTGLGLVNLNVTTRISEDNRWGQWIAIAYNFPSRLAIGIPDGAALEITRQGASVQGEDGLYVLDFSLATLAQGQNMPGNKRGMVIANGLLDVFAPEERLNPETADSDFLPVRAPTPAAQPQPQAQPTPVPGDAPGAVATQPVPTSTRLVRTQAVRTPRSTQFYRPDPEPTDPLLLNLMVVTGSLVALSILLALWINRQRINLR